jgi:hypothetical protein
MNFTAADAKKNVQDFIDCVGGANKIYYDAIIDKIKQLSLNGYQSIVVNTPNEQVLSKLLSNGFRVDTIYNDDGSETTTIYWE